MGAVNHLRGRLGRAHLSAACVSTRSTAHLHGDGSGRFTVALLCPHPPEISNSPRDYDLDRSVRRSSRDVDRYRLLIRPDQHWDAVCFHFGLPWRDHSAANRSGPSTSVSSAAGTLVSAARSVVLSRFNAEFASGDMDPFYRLAG